MRLPRESRLIKARGSSIDPETCQIALALAQIGKFSAMTYGFSTAYRRGPEVFFKSPKMTLHCYISGGNFYD
jgi:hypothetical protein